MKKLKCLSVLLLSVFSTVLFAQEYKRDVEYTEALYNFIEAYYNNSIASEEEADRLYSDAVSSISEDASEYEKEVQFARCDYLYGMYSMGEYDLESIQKIKNINDTKDKNENASETIKQKKAKAASYFDSGIEHAQKAIKLENRSDAVLIYVMCLSSNCTVKPTSYVIGNGLKVQSNAKKAIALDPKNGTAYFYQWAQDLYAPEFFANYKRGYNKMYSNYNDENLHFEKFDRFNFLIAIGDSFLKRHDNDSAKIWYDKAKAYYPNNRTLKKIYDKNY
ncbi:MAG: hypothetical protein KBT21_00585 [Treponema sp.]|nr:hypothetical protein [Candidatus Treponema merdequi]